MTQYARYDWFAWIMDLERGQIIAQSFEYVQGNDTGSLARFGQMA